MSSFRMLAAAGAASLTVAAAQAADLGFPPPPPVHEFSGWYLRGDIGMSSQNVRKLHQRLEDVVTERFDYRMKEFDSAPFFGIGIGYQLNNWLRFDITTEYRGRANLHAVAFGDQGSIDSFHGSKAEFVTLTNMYADLGTWWYLTPFIGAGVGFTRNEIRDFYDTCSALACSGQLVAVADGVGTKWDLAWALYAGVGYKVTPGVTIELAYRYLNLGNGQSGWFHNVNPAFSTAPGPYQFRGIDSQDVKLGVRFMLGEPAAPPPLLIRKG